MIKTKLTFKSLLVIIKNFYIIHFNFKIFLNKKYLLLFEATCVSNLFIKKPCYVKYYQFFLMLNVRDVLPKKTFIEFWELLK